MMNIEKLNEFVLAMEALPISMDIDMMSLKEPACGTPGCFGGLVSMIDLKELRLLQAMPGPYRYENWAFALGEFLGFERNSFSLAHWADENPLLWGNVYGGYMFASGTAYGQETNKFSHDIIVKHWRAVLNRCEEDMLAKSGFKTI